MEEEIGKLRSEVVQLQERLKATEKEKTGLEEENRALQEQVFCLQQVLWSEFERTVPGEERRKGIYPEKKKSPYCAYLTGGGDCDIGTSRDLGLSESGRGPGWGGGQSSSQGSPGLGGPGRGRTRHLRSLRSAGDLGAGSAGLSEVSEGVFPIDLENLGLVEACIGCCWLVLHNGGLG